MVLDNAMQSHDSRVCRSKLMKSDLAYVQLPLAGCITLRRMVEALDGIRYGVRRVGVDGAVDDTVAAITKDIDELECAVVNERSDRRRRRCAGRLSGCGHRGAGGREENGREKACESLDELVEM